MVSYTLDVKSYMNWRPVSNYRRDYTETAADINLQLKWRKNTDDVDTYVYTDIYIPV